MKEQDPNGLTASDPGVKFDKGKLLAGCLADFSLSLKAVAEVFTHGANDKYSRGSWQYVQNGQQRYYDAQWRHLLDERHSEIDKKSGLLHSAHLAWNALARLELILREREGIQCEEDNVIMIEKSDGSTPGNR